MSAGQMNDGFTCPHCGTRNPPGASFCYRCGAALSGEGDRPPEDPAAPLQPHEMEENIGSDAPSQRGWTGDARASEEVDAAASSESRMAAQDDDTSPRPGEPSIEHLMEYFPLEDSPDFTGSEQAAIGALRFPDEQLIGGGQGYLESVTISGDMTPPTLQQARGPAGDADHWRAIRALVREEPVLATASGQGGSSPTSYRKPLIFLMVLIAALIPFFWAEIPTFGTPQNWTGVSAAWQAINTIAPNEEVLVFWQVDPATAGELELPALPVVSNLLERGARSLVVTLQPAALATARRMYDNAILGLDESAMVTVMQGWIGDGAYLTGGTAALPLVAGDLSGLVTSIQPRSPDPGMVLVVASSAEDVQQWLEIVQPVNGLPVVAVTSAAAGPVLGPYLESGQLVGLVSGFDGAAQYQSLREQALRPADARRLALAVDAQNWGGIVLIVTALAGAIFSLTRRDADA